MSKTNIFVLIKTSWRRLLKTKTKDVFKTSSSRRICAGKKWAGAFLSRKIKLVKENKREILENKRIILVIKDYFWEIKGQIRALPTSPTPTHLCPSFSPILLEWLFLDVSSQNKISKIFLGGLFPMGQISWPLSSLKYTLITMSKSLYTLSMQTCKTEFCLLHDWDVPNNEFL